MTITETLRQLLTEEVDSGRSINSISDELPISQAGLWKFYRRRSNGAGKLLDALAERYHTRLTKPRGTPGPTAA